jgi:hypothetical protein
MSCPKYEELHQAIIDAMVAEDHVLGMNSGRRRAIGEKAFLEQSKDAHSQVAHRDWFLNEHIKDCDECKADKRAPEDHTHGQF